MTLGLVVLLALSLLAAGVAGTVDSASEPSEAFVVAFDDHGDATVTLVVTYDLKDATEEMAFDQLRDDSHEFATEYHDRMRRIVNRTSMETEREMRMANPDLSVETVGDTGVVRLSIRWEGLAATEGDFLVVTEPFASGFEPDRPLVLIAPSGYTIDTATISPSERDGEMAKWPAGTDFTGFSATIAPTDGGGIAGTGLSVPSLAGATVVFCAIGIMAYSAIYRRG